MPTLSEIIAFPPVDTGDGYDVSSAMNCVVDALKDMELYHQYDAYKGDKITVRHVVDVSYDGRRGAQTSVLRYNDVAFAVVSRAGRELGDTVAAYIVDAEYTNKALREWNSEKVTEDCVHYLDTNIGLEYWEGTPVSLGDSGWMDPDA